MESDTLQTDSGARHEHILAIGQIHSLRIWRTAADGTPIGPSPWSVAPPAQAHDPEAWLKLLHPEDRDRVRPLWRCSLREGTPFEARFRMRDGEGGFRWSLGRGLPLRDRNGAVREWLGTVADIDDLVAAEQARARSEERLRLALESTSLGIWDLDLATGEIWCSDTAARILGLPAAGTMREAEVWANLHPDDAIDFGNRLGQALDGHDEGRFELDFRIVRPGAAAGEPGTAPAELPGEVLWVSASGRTIFDSHGAAARVLGVLRDITARRLQEERLFRQAHYDPLTDLPNQRLVTLQVEALLQEGEAATLLLLDIDGFKLANDLLGHQQADQLLVRIGHRLRDGLATEPLLVARLAGDKFAVLVPGMGQEAAALRLAERVHALLAEPFGIAGQAIAVGGSIGVALAPRHAATAQELLGNADLALQDAKAAAASHTSIFQPRLREEVQVRQALDVELRRAVEAQEFELHFQPQLRLTDLRPVGVEALLRWRHPERGLLSPASFLPVLERSGSVLAVGNWVVRTAIAGAAALHAKGFPLRIAINLFSAQFRSGTVPQLLRACLAETGLPPAFVEIEVTENIILRNDDSLLACLHEIRAMGCGIAFDDFGTGHASLSMLKRFPLTRLKIDRSFVQDLHDSAEDCAIVDAILSLGRTFGVSVTAEGIETQAQARLLHARGCDEGQGWLFGRPIPLAELEALLEERHGPRDRAPGPYPPAGPASLVPGPRRLPPVPPGG